MDDVVFAHLLAAAKAGDEQAWRRLVEAFGPLVLAFARAQGHDDPEEVLSEVLVGVVRRLGSFTGDASNFRSWVFTIARSRVVDWRRRNARRPEVLGDPPEDVDRDRIASADRVAAIDHARHLLDLLDERQREIVLLRTVAELSAEETAEVVGTTAGNVRVIAHRALKQLRRVADDEE